ncbi:hypothetical protein [Candidatus Methylacidiphilum infernorum]|uniref:Uncharacterized protein n=1 Tax=Methylacidiphilum infernorum (isolate V4) TaxID=481448 RepID=B3E1A8_METI4|nr:hypothetical protein [Candidatus Methylacidiphilum infernorum]ACD82904.1 Conserved hypothetical protein [Methylacidiphilum infernorum V4]
MGIFFIVLYLVLAAMLLSVLNILNINIIILLFIFILIFLLLLFFAPSVIVLYLIHFTWDENYKTFGNLYFVENRYAQAQKALFSLFSRLSGVLIILGFLPRAIKAYEHGISFAPLNITEDLSFSAVFWSTTIINTAVILITYLFYIHYVARQIVLAEDWIEEEKIKIKKIKKMVKNIAQMKLPWQKSIFKKIIIIPKRFIKNHIILRITLLVFFLIILFSITLYIIILHIDIIYYLKKEPIYAYILLIILLTPISISCIISILYLPRRSIIVLDGSILLILCSLLIIPDIINSVDQYPQQYGGFRPEHYIAKWKGEDKEKRISVVYKTDKFLFCQPEDAQKNPNWKCSILSTEGLERLVPDTK